MFAERRLRNRERGRPPAAGASSHKSAVARLIHGESSGRAVAFVFLLSSRPIFLLRWFQESEPANIAARGVRRLALALHQPRRDPRKRVRCLTLTTSLGHDEMTNHHQQILLASGKRTALHHDPRPRQWSGPDCFIRGVSF
jgi:hypothetical protein